MSISDQYFDNNKKYEKQYGYKTIVIYPRNKKLVGKEYYVCINTYFNLKDIFDDSVKNKFCSYEYRYVYPCVMWISLYHDKIIKNLIDKKYTIVLLNDSGGIKIYQANSNEKK
jgi:hypothetical protein